MLKRLIIFLNIVAIANNSNCSGMTELMRAAFKNDIKSIESLIKNGANVNTQDAYGRTALIVAAEDNYYNNYKSAELLIENGANLDIQDNDGNTALMVACVKYPSLARLLIEKGADVNKRNKRGVTALMIAKANVRVDIMQMLTAHGAVN